jgi:hypothetical protein
MMSEHELAELIRQIKKSVFPIWLKWIMGIISGIIIGMLTWMLLTGFNTVVGQKQNSNDIILIQKELEKKVDASLFRQYIEANGVAHENIKEEMKNVTNGQLVIQSDIKELLKRK